ncbi:MAG TPA: putative molybdenum carrier protein [Usitatibacter sp.]|nr:putative molybdenum carrier protein [Usitatibacter sp.]
MDSIRKIISGGQTGVDRAALDAALALGVEAGGWCPHGRRAEDGPISRRYPLKETRTEKYPPRTALNVREADATLILHLGALDGGSRLTHEIADRSHKAQRCINLADRDALDQARAWLRETSPRTLNVAGPRESRQPGIYPRAYGFLVRLLKEGCERYPMAGPATRP